MQARPLLTQALEDRNFDIVADPRLQKDYNPIEMSQIVACASVCVRHLARRRPKMSQVTICFYVLFARDKDLFTSLYLVNNFKNRASCSLKCHF